MSDLTATADALTARGLPTVVAPWEGGPVLLITTELARYAAWLDRGTPELHTEDLHRVIAWSKAPVEDLAEWVATRIAAYEAPPPPVAGCRWLMAL